MPILREIEVALSCGRSEEHTSELQSLAYLVCRLLLEKKKQQSRLCGTLCRHAADSAIRLLDYSDNLLVLHARSPRLLFFFFYDTATTEFYTLSLHDALPISTRWAHRHAYPMGSPSLQVQFDPSSAR